MTRFQLLLFFIVLTQLAIAQEQKVETLEGRVVSKEQEVVGVYVLNKSAKKATITDPKGYFTLKVALQDTLLFSAVQFKNREIIITQKILDLKSYIINLDETLEELDEVVLDNRTFITAKSLGLPNADVKTLPLAEREVVTATKWITNNKVGIDPFLNFLSGRTKMLKERASRDQSYAHSKELRSSYVDSIFSKSLDIPIDRIDEFMLYCEYDKRFDGIFKAKNELVVWDFLRQKSELFLKFKEE
ncbi:carboxypeptidase-like regulatory domain-containing protein [Cellulophaga sp. 20_2_10]|uniref:carboxypeptidase-like regulatory domain-containing protein n=1 Tax=Cellulophaga sp. 20_2_10 TaxID=2942476 RepID=UPI00201AB22B|nr:carboxypeptidase-like regulatory domain-containing protein [Cellulophaga sp. 20_2_10]MCL5247091.1 carboxypeptidase-like regulatory domain-containing protein [Cellulophaga sp. 20_2_10]